jgi:glycosyltransferase involved in cell wall biosynthesis
MRVESATVLICTHNRHQLLRQTMAALQQMRPCQDCNVELLIVDNNSTESTRHVVDEAAKLGPHTIRYLREERQGKSFALNLGLAHASGNIIALTDDDVVPSAEWLSRIVADFRQQDVTFVFGKVLPLWGCVPPPELLISRAQGLWGPLAIVDYGDEPIAYVPESSTQRLPIGANLAFVKSVLLTVGGWRTDLGKVNNTLISGEDHEIFLRLRRHQLYRGYYDPEVTVRHHVPPERLTRRYFRQWFYWHGKTQALMLDAVFLEVDVASVPRIAGVPRFVYRQAIGQFRRWIASLGSGDALAVLTEELRSLRYAGLLTECWRRRTRQRRVALAETAPRAPGLLGS